MAEKESRNERILRVIVINLWGGPGCGKSTTAAGLFSLMKMRGHQVELVTEYAKDLTYEEDWLTLTKQDLILPEQLKRQQRLTGKVDYVITDSPLPLNIIYANKILNDDFYNRVLETFNQFENFNIFLKRVKPYSHYGRKETSDRAIAIDCEIRELLDSNEITYHLVRGDEDSSVIIYNLLFNNYEIKLNENNH